MNNPLGEKEAYGQLRNLIATDQANLDLPSFFERWISEAEYACAELAANGQSFRVVFNQGFKPLENVEVGLVKQISEEDKRLFEFPDTDSKVPAPEPHLDARLYSCNSLSQERVHRFALRYDRLLLGVLFVARDESDDLSSSQIEEFIDISLLLASWSYSTRQRARLSKYLQTNKRLREQMEQAQVAEKKSRQKLDDILHERMVEQERLEFDAFHDKLTGLPNRALFTTKLQERLDALQAGTDSDFAVFFLDLDGFKGVNDTFGHMAGDELLKKVSRQLLESVRPGDMVARLAGDEFCILLVNCINEQQAVRVANRIVQSFDREFWVGDDEVRSSCSIGISLDHAEAASVSDILRDADAAMYESKSRGKNCYQVYNPALAIEAKDRPDLEADVYFALERNQIELGYQPILNAETGDIVGVDMIPQWIHEQIGLVTRDHFLRCVKEADLLTDVLNYCLEESLQQIAQWRRDFPKASGMELVLNFSRLEVDSADLETLLGIVRHFQARFPSGLAIELTEEILLSEFDKLVGEFKHLPNTRLNLVLDDFATGYSSLPLLYQVPLTSLKVDLSSISAVSYNDRNLAILHTLQALAESLNLPLAAEGVETESDFNAVQEIRARYIQGSQIKPRTDAESVTKLLEAAKG